MTAAVHKRYDGSTVEEIEVWSCLQPWGTIWKMHLEKHTTVGGTISYMIYCYGGQSYPVGKFRSLKKAHEFLRLNFNMYTRTK
jgi:hypothetical protein